MSLVSIDMGTHDIYFDDIARQVIEDCNESDMLIALADANAQLARDSGDDAETKFAREAAERLRELAKWFAENQP